jgi:transcriptional regulator with XRE-family HTH domain
MTNSRLRGLLAARGMTAEALAAEIGVDTKTVRRWISEGRTPHRATALRVATRLESAPTWLWPDMDPEAGDVTELVRLYPHRADAPKHLWLDLLRSAENAIDLLANASLFLPEDNPESIGILREKAASGVAVRLVLGDPDSPEIALRGDEEELYEGLVGRVRMALAYYQPLLGVDGVDFHLHRTALYNSIFRYDDQMLVNQHVFGVYGYLAPLIHLRRQEEGSDLFDLYARSFEKVWRRSSPYRPASG